MQHRLSEEVTFGKPLVTTHYSRPGVLAPHPDDEVYGCGGLLALWAQAGVQVQVALVTAGQAQEAEAAEPVRLSESRAAAAILGHAVECWGFMDREVQCDEHLIERTVRWLQDGAFDVVLAPALSEPHPDHQACTLALACALGRLRGSTALPDVLLYESGGGLTHANTLVDITGVRDRKQAAMLCFASQEQVQPYASRIEARDHYRALTLGPAAQAAEVFHQVGLSEGGWPAWIAALEPLFGHARGQASTPSDIPLVSVLVRTMGDPHLPRTIASVLAQTYPRLELVIVAAHGQTEPPDALPSTHHIPMRWIGGTRALNRPQAANAALDAARGDCVIFLDDDDLWLPDHIQVLVSARLQQTDIKAVHTDVRVVDQDGKELTRYDQPYARARLAFTNVFPIHSVLFDRAVCQSAKLRFDETLPVLEDWDFWLQLAEHTGFAHVPVMSAIYRYRDRSGLERAGEHHQQHWRETVLQRWWSRWPAPLWWDAARWYAGALDIAQQAARFQQHRAEALLEQENVWQQERVTWSERLQTAEARAAAQQAALRDELALASARLDELHAWAQDQDAERKAAQQALASCRAELNMAAQQLAQKHRELDTANEERRATQLQAQDLRLELSLAGERLRQATDGWAAERAARADHERALQDRLEQVQALQRTREEQGEAHIRDLRQELQRSQATAGRAEALALELQQAAGQLGALHTQAELNLERAIRAEMAQVREREVAQAQLEGKTAELGVLRERILHLEHSKRASEEQSSAAQMVLQAQLAEQSRLHQDLLRSTSWKITRPLRWLGSLLRRSN